MDKRQKVSEAHNQNKRKHPHTTDYPDGHAFLVHGETHTALGQVLCKNTHTNITTYKISLSTHDSIVNEDWTASQINAHSEVAHKSLPNTNDFITILDDNLEDISFYQIKRTYDADWTPIAPETFNVKTIRCRHFDLRNTLTGVTLTMPASILQAREVSPPDFPLGHVVHIKYSGHGHTTQQGMYAGHVVKQPTEQNPSYQIYLFEHGEHGGAIYNWSPHKVYAHSTNTQQQPKTNDVITLYNRKITRLFIGKVIKIETKEWKLLPNPTSEQILHTPHYTIKDIHSNTEHTIEEPHLLARLAEDDDETEPPATNAKSKRRNKNKIKRAWRAEARTQREINKIK